MRELPSACWGGLLAFLFGKAFGAGMGAALRFAYALALRARFGFGDINQVTDLFAQDTGFDFFDFALAEIAELEGPVRNSDEAVHMQAQRIKGAAHLAVFAFADSYRNPGIITFLAF